MRIIVCLLIGFMGVWACSGGSDSGSSSSSNGGGGGGGDGGVTSNTCYRSPSDLASYLVACSENFHASVAAWIKNDFKCVDVTVSGGNHVFEAGSRPNHKSFYYKGADSAHTDTMPPGTSGNPNSISAQNYELNIPVTPALTATPTASGMDIVGVTVNGVAIFNNQAAPGDSLAAELASMDYGNGHPTGVGTYHYHIEPCYLTNNDGNLVGVMRDGYPIFGQKEPDGSTPVYDDNCTYANAGSVNNCRPYPTQLPNFHCHSIASFTGPSCHYHVITTDPFIIQYYAGTAGTYTNP